MKPWQPCCRVPSFLRGLRRYAVVEKLVEFLVELSVRRVGGLASPDLCLDEACTYPRGASDEDPSQSKSTLSPPRSSYFQSFPSIGKFRQREVLRARGSRGCLFLASSRVWTLERVVADLCWFRWVAWSFLALCGCLVLAVLSRFPGPLSTARMTWHWMDHTSLWP